MVNKEDGKLFDNKEGYLSLKNNFVINLRTKEVYQRQKEDYFTYEIPIIYDPNNNDTRFEEFINTIMLEDKSKQDKKEKSTCLQILLGYAITGSTKERILPVLIGEGSNGKSTLLSILREGLGPLLTHVDKCVILNKGQSKGAANPELHSLRSCRIAMITETEKNEYINQSMFKRMTGGGDTLTSRDLFQGIQQWIPKFCPIMITNNPPKSSNEAATLGRLLFLEFLTKFIDNPTTDNERKKDVEFTKILLENSFKEAFLKWIIEGAYKYYNGGLFIPDCVKVKSDEYKSAQDTLQLFIDTDLRKPEINENSTNEDKEEAARCIETWVSGAALYQRYVTRCTVEKVPKSVMLSSKEFGIVMKEKYPNKRSNGIKYFVFLTQEETGSLLSF
jgi:putative DNA primase/helicase